VALEPVITLLFWSLCWIVPAALLLGLLYFLLSLPLRRLERARFFLDVLDTAGAAGQAPEHAIVAMSRSRDRSLGLRFHWLAALLESGRRLGPALDEVPGFLPPRLQAMLKVGLDSGEVGRVLPACRHQLRDGISQTQGGINYAILLVFTATPATTGIALLLAVFVFPRFREILSDLGVGTPALSAWVFDHALLWAWLGGAMMLLLAGFAVLYVGGPHLIRGLRRSSGAGIDWITWHVPWKRRRILRDFAALLALLLDQGLPEAQALTLAADGAANETLRGMARAAREDLAAGRPLPEAMRRIDDTGPFQWRLRNLAGNPGSFAAGLAGWLETLDARAFQQEQAAAQLITTAMILFNGGLVGLLVTGVFQALTSIVQVGVLW
jgi:type II secretory pathway component PulF